MSDRQAQLFDLVRKALTFLVAAAGTWLLLRILFRTAEGTQRLGDPELIGLVLLTAAAIAWVRATRRMPRRTVVGPDSAPGEPGDGFRTDSTAAASGTSREIDRP